MEDFDCTFYIVKTTFFLEDASYYTYVYIIYNICKYYMLHDEQMSADQPQQFFFIFQVFFFSCLLLDAKVHSPFLWRRGLRRHAAEKCLVLFDKLCADVPRISEPSKASRFSYRTLVAVIPLQSRRH